MNRAHCMSLVPCCVLQEAGAGESVYQLCEESVAAAGRYFIRGTDDYCPVVIEWVGQDCEEVWLAGSFTEWRQQPLTQRYVYVCVFVCVCVK